MDLKLSLSNIPGVGPAQAKKLEKLELFTVEDLIYHFPFRYDDYSIIKPISETQIGEIVTISGEIWSIKNIYTRYGKNLTQAIFNDGKTSIYLTWFNQPYLSKQISSGDRLYVSGKLIKYQSKLSILAPDWEKIEPTHGVEGVGPRRSLHTGRLVPIYPETFGLTSRWIRRLTSKVLSLALKEIKDFLPNQIRGEMIKLDMAIQKIHFPENQKDIDRARERLGFDELFLIQLATQQVRARWRSKPLIKPWIIDKETLQKFIKSLPFELTESQQKVLAEIRSDLNKSFPMNRLLQGEVGSGKTVIAAAAIYLAKQNGFQSLLMAPTEILAWQHFDTLKKLLEPFGTSIGVYTKSKKQAVETTDDVVVGTQALLSDSIKPRKVGLVIIDEQHRFGVNQRTLLRKKGSAPHFLTMTATPIPRTVALTLYADLDLSVIDELPKERPVIKTHLVPERKREDAYKFIEKKVEGNDQAYIITPLIDPPRLARSSGEAGESETRISSKAATVEFEKLKAVFPNLFLGLLHGRLKAKEKEAVLDDFRSGKVQILVSTSVVEVGVDVANATLMLIEGAERFGLAQLHQLRGRIGRGVKESFCLLFTENENPNENQRLKYLETTFNGLRLAELDLKIRGQGTIFSTTQHGRFELKIARLSDIKLVEKIKTLASKLLEKDLELDKYPQLKRKLQGISQEVMPD